MGVGKKERFAALGLEPDLSAEEFAERLKQRHHAAKGLERDLLTEVPMLYGSPDKLSPQGDPGVIIAQSHRANLLRRNGCDAPNPSGTPDEVRLPFERAIYVLVFVMWVLTLFEKSN